ncbi:MAG: universal stress protein [Bacillota bacterium]
MLKILIGIDGSESSKKAVNEIGDRLAPLELNITLVHVLKETNISIDDSTGKPNEDADSVSPRKIKQLREHNKLKEEAKELLNETELLLQEKGLEAEKVLLQGDAADEICKFADENDIDLIVLGNRGVGGIKKFLLGSTSEKVLNNAERSVCVIK